MHACHAPCVLIIRGGLSSQALAGIGAVVLSREVAIAVGMAAASVKAVSEQLPFQPQPFDFVNLSTVDRECCVFAVCSRSTLGSLESESNCLLLSATVCSHKPRAASLS